MAIQRRDDWLTTPQGQALAGALVYYCTQPAFAEPLPPGPLAAAYAGTAGGLAANPQTTDGFGHAVAYLDNGHLYTIVFVHPLLAEPLVLVDQNLGGGGAGNYTTFSQMPAGLIDGVNRTFTLAASPQLCLLTQNGLTVTPGLTYVLTGSTIEFATAPAPGDTLFAQGIVSSGATPFSQVPVGAIDGENRTFLLADVPVLLFFSWDGVVLTPGVGYTIAGKVVTMTNAPAAGDTLYAQGIF